MEIRVNPCLVFDGCAREAMVFYQSILGGQLEIGTVADYYGDEGPDRDKVAHGVLTTPTGVTLMGWDAPARLELSAGNSVAVFLSGDDPVVRSYFRALSAGGTVLLPLAAKPWGKETGSLRDRYGVDWMFSLTHPQVDAPHLATDDAALDRLLGRMARHEFRAKFKLYGRERAIVDLRGIKEIKVHAAQIISRRLAPAEPVKDGRQTPYRGHPVFVAQHATATCCRTCLSKWHGIGVGKPLSEQESEYVVSVMMRWITKQYEPGAPPP